MNAKFQTINNTLIDPSKVITAMTQGVQNYWGERAAILVKIKVKLVEQEVYRFGFCQIRL